MTHGIPRIGLIAIAIAITAAPSLGASPAPGDRHPEEPCVYPADVFWHAGKGGRVIDVTMPPFHAKGDGVTDDTTALIRAYDFVLAEMDKSTWNGAGPESDLCETIIYLPKGTYLVSDTIIYSGPWRSYPGHEEPRDGQRTFERLVKIRFFGEERDKTVIQLKDDCPGFDQGAKPVISFGKSDLNNAVAYNAFRNITVDTGTGNPAAIGLDFCGANNSGIHNVSIVSGDGQGVAGIDFRICPAMGFHDDISIHGFDYGIRSLPYHMTHNCFEFVTLEKQTRAGIQIGECSASIRKLLSTNRVPATLVTTASGQVVMIDSRLEGENAKQDAPAIDAPQGHLFVRNVEISGYGTTIRVKGEPVLDTLSVGEFVTVSVLTLRQDQQRRSLNLPIEETPQVDRPTDFSCWANVDKYGAKGDGRADDSAGIQAALDSGKPVVYFPKAVYRLGTPVNVPPSVQRIMAFYGSVNGQMVIAEDCPQPLLIEDFGTDSRTFIQHRAPRTLVLSHVRCVYFHQNPKPGAKVFINNCNGLGKSDRVFKNGRFWVRFMNTEYKQGPNFTCNGSDMWVFGYKVEGHMTNFESINGGRLEVLGGICNEHGSCVEPDTPILRNVDSSLSYVGYTNGPNRFETIVEETIQGRTKRLLWEDLPPRPGSGNYRRWSDVFVPLYVSGHPMTGTKSGGRRIITDPR